MYELFVRFHSFIIFFVCKGDMYRLTKLNFTFLNVLFLLLFRRLRCHCQQALQQFVEDVGDIILVRSLQLESAVALVDEESNQFRQRRHGFY